MLTTETLPAIGTPPVVLTRVISSILPYTVTFPTRTGIATQIQLSIGQPVVIGAQVSAAITSQSVNTPQSPGPVQNPFNAQLAVGTVQLQTITTGPWALSTSPGTFSIVRIQDESIFALLTPAPGSIGCAGAAVNCIQQWTILLLPTNSAVCALDGQYVALFSVQCQVGVVGCTVPPTGATATVNMSIASSSFCASLVAAVDLSASFFTYQVRHGTFRNCDCFYVRR